MHISPELFGHIAASGADPRKRVLVHTVTGHVFPTDAPVSVTEGGAYCTLKLHLIKGAGTAFVEEAMIAAIVIMDRPAVE